jgi:hypothetical protein
MEMQVIEFASDLTRALTWSDCTLAYRVVSEYREYLAMKANRTIEEVIAWDCDFADALEILLGSLDSKSHFQFVTSPIFASLTIMPSSVRDPGKRQFILKTLKSYVEDRCYRAPIEIGTSGDATELFDSSSNFPTNTAGEEMFGYHGNRIHFDDNLPIPLMDRGGSNLSAVKDDTVRNTISAKLCAANTILRSNRLVSDFAIVNTELIICRLENEYPFVFSSGSFRLMPGLSLLCNSHLLTVTQGKVADALLHEAIHAIIYRYEAYGQRMVPKEKENSAPLKSLWTGRHLSPTSFVQACFVWFGLYHFWKQYANRNSGFDQYLETAQSGFLSPNYSKTCRGASAILSAGMAEQLENLAEFIR